jgi:hypothetical protein
MIPMHIIFLEYSNFLKVRVSYLFIFWSKVFVFILKYLLKGIDVENEKSKENCFKKAEENFQKCIESYKSMDPPPHKFTMSEFMIAGQQTGLARLIAFDESKLKNELETFEENLQFDGRLYYFKLKNIIKLTVMERYAFEEKDKIRKNDAARRDRYSFNIIISRSGLKMFKYENISQSN